MDDGRGNAWLMAKAANGVELIYSKQESRPGNTPIALFAIAEGRIDDMVSELASKGVTILTPVSHAPGGWSAEFKYPEGHVLSVYQVRGQAVACSSSVVSLTTTAQGLENMERAAGIEPA